MFITILSQKGSQAKTSTAVNLAAALAAKRPGIVVDLDAQQCDALRYAGSIPGVTFCAELPTAAPDGGFVVVDTPPQIMAATGAALKRSDLILIPCTPAAASLESLARTFQTVGEVWELNNELRALVVFACVNRSQYAAGMIEAARVLSAWPVAQTVIPARAMDFERAYSCRVPVVLNAPRSAGAAAYRALANEIETLLETK